MLTSFKQMKRSCDEACAEWVRFADTTVASCPLAGVLESARTQWMFFTLAGKSQVVGRSFFQYSRSNSSSFGESIVAIFVTLPVELESSFA
jgi:phage terminase large subunit-like protein